ncbi:FAD-binding monooxygenase-like protein [Mollisia scopiformis]|uniref:FAD-binding monooxygenase-like protein n=1 Tax=Mollisia scopiformis TaxID=149040 RepID=A0A132B4W4_MOLSC|nr:FAD-binding monooxygenase-like protein [Mollisia scopiformis]KUJ06944.1 FAD-binding monooxygenase-like protein [Mollisia scopiformis]
MAEHFPVVIIGGGIVGLSASLFLSSHKISHLLIERHSGTSIHPRARGFNTRAMEIFRSVHFDDLVRDAGAELQPSMGICRGNSLAEVMEPRKRKEGKKGEMPFAFADGVSPVKGARCTQDMLEPVLVKTARERGGNLRFNTLCERIEQDENGVTVTLRGQESDTTSTVRAEYLIAADGAGSPIRKQLGIGTTGKGSLGNLINILFHADLRELVKGREISLCTIERPEVRGIFTAINNSDRWVFHLSYDPSKGEKASDYTMERCEQLLRIAIGVPDIKIDIKSALPWHPSDIAAERMKQGRIFLAGDAAHQTTPYAGQGATTGIADVFDLTWKIAMVLKGTANQRLLETYESERVPVARFVAAESGKMADQYGLLDTTHSLFVFMLRALWRIPMYTGFGYQYTSQATIPEEPTPSAWTSWWFVPWTIPSLVLGFNGKPGTRAPHTWVQHEGQQISTLDLFGKNFVLLTGSEGKSWCHAASEVAENLGLELDAYRVGPTGDLSDPKRQWETAAGISSQGALLVRPDGFVAWRVKDQDGDLRERLGGALKHILGL